MNIRFGELALARAQAEQAIELSNGMQKSETSRDFIDMLGKTVLGQVAIELGDHEEAHQYLSGAIESAERLEGFGDAFAAQVTAGTVEQLVTLGRFEEAVQQLECLETAAEAVAAPWLDSITARARGFVAAASGDTSGALAHFERALSIMEAAPTSRFELGRTLLALGQLQRRSRQRLVARATLERAHEVFESAGARLWAEKACAELRQIGGRPTTEHGLTATEERIARRVAEGRSNTEVAHELFISPKTVEWNLTKIYRKLHVRSRADLAARFAKRASNQ